MNLSKSYGLVSQFFSYILVQQVVLSHINFISFNVVQLNRQAYNTWETNQA